MCRMDSIHNEWRSWSLDKVNPYQPGYFTRAILALALRARGVHARCPAGMCPRFVLATEGIDTPTPEGACANLGQNIQPAHFCRSKNVRPRPKGSAQDVPSTAAKRTVMQTATLDTGWILHDHQQVTCEKERTGEISGLARRGHQLDCYRPIFRRIRHGCVPRIVEMMSLAHHGHFLFAHNSRGDGWQEKFP